MSARVHENLLILLQDLDRLLGQSLVMLGYVVRVEDLKRDSTVSSANSALVRLILFQIHGLVQRALKLSGLAQITLTRIELAKLFRNFVDLDRFERNVAMIDQVLYLDSFRLISIEVRAVCKRFSQIPAGRTLLVEG